MMTKRARRLSCTIAGALCLAILSQTAWAAVDLTIAWDPNPEPNLEGYAVYLKKKAVPEEKNLHGHVALEDLDDPNAPHFQVSGLENNGTYYIALKAYDTAGQYSSFSEPICVQVTDNVIGLCSETDADDGGGSSNGGSGGSGGCFVGTVSDSAPDLGVAGTVLALVASVMAGLRFFRKHRERCR
jgi:hypothetical protein